jgi:hypothetical protein
LLLGSFAVYDFPHDSINGRLAPYYEKHIDINSKNLNNHFNNFSNWIINLSFLRAYIMLEALLLRAIQDAYFPSLDSPIHGRVEMNKLNKKITDELKSNNHDIDQKNNRHLIKFLSVKSDKFLVFKNQLIRTDLNSNWEEFFEFISILRNVIAHHDMIITKNIHNELKKNCKLLFERHFKLVKDENDQNILFFEKKQLRQIF